MPKRSVLRRIDDSPYQGGSSLYVGTASGGGAYVPISRRLIAGGGIDILPVDGRLDEDLTISLGSAAAGAGLSYTAGVLAVNPGDGLGISGDVVYLLPTVAGAALGYSAGVLSVVPGEGLELEGDAIGLKASIAGFGLTYAAGILHVGAGNGITVNADDVALMTPGTVNVSSINDASGNHKHQVQSSANVAATPVASLLASDAGGMLSLKRLGLGTVVETTSNNISGSGHIVMSAAQSIWLIGDSDNNETGSVVFGFNTPNTTGMTEVARITEPGRLGIMNPSPTYPLDVTGSARVSTILYTPKLATVSGDMEIAPVGDLLINPGGLDVVYDFDSAVRSDNFLKTILIAGFRIGPTSVAGQTGVQAGSAEFDELRARIFVADETRVDRGQEYITKSYGILSRPFTSPSSVGGTANLYVENSPHIIGAVFSGTTASDGDWVLLRYLDMSSGILLTSVWGQVYGYNITGLTGEQRWTFVHRSGPVNLAFAKGALVVDFGAAASQPGYILSDAVTATAPYVQVGRWVTNPYTPANYSVLTQIGRLDGVGFTGEYGIAATKTNFAQTASWFRLTNTTAMLNNIPLQLWNGSNQTVNISSTGTDVWIGTALTDQRLTWNGSLLTVRGAIYVTGGNAATFDNVTGALNLVRNSSFELDSNSDGLADNFAVYNNDGAGVPTYASITSDASKSSKSQRIYWIGTNATSKGIAFNTGVHKANVTYMVTFWCRTNINVPIQLAHNIQPTKVNVLWPTANVGWQFFAVKCTWATENNDNWYFTIGYGQAITSGWIEFDNIMIYEGDQIVAYQPSPNDTVAYGGLVNMPSAPGTTPGLYLTSTQMGYYNGSAWKTWLSSNGDFYFGSNTGASLRWSSTLNRLSGYDSGNYEQWYADAATGKLYFGNGKGWLDREGFSIVAPGVIDAGVDSYISWRTWQNTGVISAYINAAFHGSSADPAGRIYLVARKSSGVGISQINMSADEVNASAPVSVYKLKLTQNKILSDSLVNFQTLNEGAWQYVGVRGVSVADGTFYTDVSPGFTFYDGSGKYQRINAASAAIYTSNLNAWAGGYYSTANSAGYAYREFYYNSLRIGYQIWYADKLGYYTENNSHFFVALGGTGKFGINTTAPSFTFDVTGEARVTGAIRTSALSMTPAAAPAASATYVVLFVDTDLKLKYRLRTGDGSTIRTLSYT